METKASAHWRKTALALLIAGLAGPAAAEEYTVNVTHGDFAVPAALAEVPPRCDTDAATGGNQCSLVAAIQAANEVDSRDEIVFQNGLGTIVLNNSLPSISHPVDIEGQLAGEDPATAIDGNNNSLFTFDYEASLDGGSSMANLKIFNGGGEGIRLNGTPYILDNLWVGLNVAGTAAAGNGSNGIVVQNTGSSTAALVNDLQEILSALGIDSFGELGTVFGTDPLAFVAAVTALLGQNNAIAITNSVISGNEDAGVRIAGGLDGMGNDVLTAGVILAGNRIGTNAEGTDVVPNGTGTTGDGSGVLIEINAALNFVIGNVIAGNEGDGVSLVPNEVDFPNVIGGNFIGLPNPADLPNPLGLDAETWGNFENGVKVTSWPSTGNGTQTSAVVAANLIGFSRCGTWTAPDADPDLDDGGIAVSGGTTDKTILVGNLVGVAQFPPAGGDVVDFGNLCTGINVGNGSHIIGGANILDANAIGANEGDGILLRNNSTNGNVVKGNRIGRDYLDQLTFPNTGYGIRLQNSGGNIIGFEDGDAPLFGPNVIASPGSSGIQVAGDNAFGNLLRRNRIYGVPPGFQAIDLDRDNLPGDQPDPIDDDDTSVNPLQYANWAQNAPQICTSGIPTGPCSGATDPNYAGGNTNLQWTLFSFRNASFRIDVYSISDADAQWLEEFEIATDANGIPTSSGPCNAQALCTSAISSDNTSGTQIVLTATRIDENIADIPPLEPDPPGNPNDDGPINNTSEYSAPATIPEQIVFAQASTTVAESDGTAQLTISRIGTGAASITLQLNDLTTQAADHGALSATTLTWAADEAQDKQITIPITQDAIDEPNQSFEVSFTIDSPATTVAGDPDTAQVTITDDDASPLLTIAAAGAAEGDSLTYTITRAGTSEFTTTVDYLVSPRPGTEAADFDAGAGPFTATIAPGATTATVLVLAVDDAIYEPAELVRVDMTNPVNAVLSGIGGNFADAAIAASDVAPVFNISSPIQSETDANAPLVFVVSKVGLTEIAASVQYATTPGSATTPEDYVAGISPLSGTLNFAAGDATQNISLTLVGDDVFEPAPDQTFDVTLSAPVEATLGTAVGTATISDDDSAVAGQVRYTAATFDVNETEAAVNAIVTVERFGGTDGAASVDCVAAAGTATAGADFTPGNVTASWNNGEGGTRQCLIPIAGDALDEADETVLLSLANASGVAIAAPSSATLTILDNDALPVVSIGAPMATAEGDDPDTTPFVFQVQLSTASGRAVSVQASSSDGSATLANNDYAALNQTVNFAAGQTLQTVTVNVTGDSADESDETFSVTLTAPTNATLQDTPEVAIATILNDDAPPPPAGQVRFTATTYGVGESSGPAVIAVERVNGTTGAISVDCVSSAGTATAADFTAATQTLNWANGVAGVQNCSVAISADTLDEDDETVMLALANVQGGATIDSPSAATLTIADDDAPPVVSIADLSLAEGNGPAPTAFNFMVTLSTPSGRAVAVSATTADGSATAPADYASAAGVVNFPAGSTSQMFAVSVVGDTTDEADDAFEVVLSAPSNATLAPDPSSTGTIQNDDAPPSPGVLQFSAATYSVGEAGVQATITVTRTGGSAGAVAVSYATSNGTAVAGSDYTSASGTLNWGNGISTPQTFTVPIANDAADEPDETVNLALSAPTGGATLGAVAAAVLTIVDDDAPTAAGTLQFSAATYSVGEAGVQATITVTRAGGSDGAVQVDYATSNGSALAGTDYTAASGTLSWGDGVTTSQTFQVAIANDSADEADETINLALSGATNGATLGSPATAVLTITDDDATPGNKTFTGPTPTGSGPETIMFTGGGDPCGFVAGTALVATPTPLPPGGYVFPHGVFASRIENCTVGATLSFTATYPQALPAGTVFWKYGRTQAEPTLHWYQYPATIAGNTATFTLVDGGAGDDDLTANGTIVDPSGPAFLQGIVGPVIPVPQVVPTMGDVARWLLMLLVAGIAMTQLRSPALRRVRRD
jgi:hypothetical protein